MSDKIKHIHNQTKDEIIRLIGVPVDKIIGPDTVPVNKIKRPHAVAVNKIIRPHGEAMDTVIHFQDRTKCDVIHFNTVAMNKIERINDQTVGFKKGHQDDMTNFKIASYNRRPYFIKPRLNVRIDIHSLNMIDTIKLSLNEIK